MEKVELDGTRHSASTALLFGTGTPVISKRNPQSSNAPFTGEEENPSLTF